jgi:hypothetical protein
LTENTLRTESVIVKGQLDNNSRDAVDALVEKMRESAELVYEQLVIDRRRYNKMRAEDPDNERVGAGN